MKYLYKFESEEKKDTLGRGEWPWLKTKMSLLEVGDTLLFTGPTKKALQKVRRIVNKVSKGTGTRYTFGHYIETPITGVVKGMVGRKQIGSEWQIEGRVTSQLVTS
jgi:hypothetical protein